MSKQVIVTAEFVNLTPAHKRYITKQGEGYNWPLALYRAAQAIARDERVKGKRVVYPIKLVIQDGQTVGE
jgi:hypothetical protein